MDTKSWQLTDLLEQAPGFLSLGDALVELADEDPTLCVGTADLKYSNGLVRFEEKHPERFHQFGISEQNMVSAAAGMAAAGARPYIATFASFLALLCCEQIRTDVAYTKLPVRLIGHHTGIALGFYGTSHHATEDIAIMRSLANMTVISPADSTSLAALLKDAHKIDGPVYFRIGRGRDEHVYTTLDTVKVGQAVQHRSGTDAIVISTGGVLASALSAAVQLSAAGFDVGVIDMHTIKPLDVEAILNAAASTSVLVTVEEHNILGGLGSAVSEIVAEAGLGTRVHRHGIRDEYAPVGPPTSLYRHYRLDDAGIADVVTHAIQGLSA